MARRAISDADLAKKLSEIYFSPKGYTGIRKLTERLRGEGISVSEARVKRWVQSQAPAAVQVKVNRDKLYRERAMTVVESNAVQSADLLFMPRDPDGSRYALVVVDAASRFKAAEPLKTKTAGVVLAALERIWARTPLKPPQVLKLDSGKEFEGAFRKRMEELGVKLRIAPKGDHRAQSMVESANGALARRLFGPMRTEEMKRFRETGAKIVDRKWVANLQPVIDAMNSEKTALTGESPEDAIKQKLVIPLASHAPPEKPLKDQVLLEEGVRVRVLLPEPEDGGSFRATDNQFSTKVYKISNYSVKPQRPISYQVEPQDKLTRGRWFVRGMLLVDTSAPTPQAPADRDDQAEPAANKDGQYEVEAIVGKRKSGRKVEYEVKWKGYKETTWEPRSSLQKQIPGMVRDFEKKSKK